MKSGRELGVQVERKKREYWVKISANFGMRQMGAKRREKKTGKEGKEGQERAQGKKRGTTGKENGGTKREVLGLTLQSVRGGGASGTGPAKDGRKTENTRRAARIKKVGTASH